MEEEGPALEFWFDFASPYSYVGALSIEEACRTRGVALAWRPFALGAVFKAQLGSSDSPFNRQPVRRDYLWRDIERLCARKGAPFRRPSVFPRNPLLALRMAFAAAGEPWEGDFIRAVFHAHFALDADIAEADVLAGCLAPHVAEPLAFIATATTDRAKAAFRAQTERAMALPLFGAPTCVTRGERFFGQDRIHEALDWAQGPWL
jgi:2-hydroxychromene-2-carboxylate isomerase